MSAVKYFVILILGTVIVRLFGMSGSDKVQERAQMCYVTDVIDGAYVSREAYRTLVGIMPNNFLRIESATQLFCQSVQLQQAHLMRSATALVTYAPSRHHYQLLYLSQQLMPTEPLSRKGY